MRARTHIEAFTESDTPITHRAPRSPGSIHLHQPFRTGWPRKLLFRSASVFMRARSRSEILGFASVEVPLRVCIPQAVQTQQLGAIGSVALRGATSWRWLLLKSHLAQAKLEFWNLACISSGLGAVRCAVGIGSNVMRGITSLLLKTHLA